MMIKYKCMMIKKKDSRLYSSSSSSSSSSSRQYFFLVSGQCILSSSRVNEPSQAKPCLDDHATIAHQVPFLKLGNFEDSRQPFCCTSDF